VRTIHATFVRRRVAAALVLLGVALLVTALVLRLSDSSSPDATAASTGTSRTTTHHTSTTTTPGVYAHIGADALSPAVAHDPARVYVPNGVANTVAVIDQATHAVISTFRTAAEPQHIVPSFDLRTLWVLDNKGDRLVPIDPATGKAGTPVAVTDPYNLYFTPDGSSAIVVAEAKRRLDFRDPHTMELRFSIPVPDCAGINHADYDASFRYLLLTCEFNGRLAKVDVRARRVLGMLDLTAAHVEGQPSPGPHAMPEGKTSSSMPQDIRVGPDGRHFFVADMLAGGVFVVDGDRFAVDRFVPTGIGAHGLTVSRDGTTLYVANRGSTSTSGSPHGPGSVSVFDPASDAVVATWPVPKGGSPDMGNVSADGKELWLSGRFDSEVYVFDTGTGALTARIPVGQGPHGLAVWPQPGRFSLGHTGNMR
jgi:YVTN family beta-propeller protein